MPIIFDLPAATGSTFAELKSDVETRGYAYAGDARIGKYVNEAVEWICEQENWPFCEVTLTGSSAPVQIDGLLAVRHVRETSRGISLPAVSLLTLKDRPDFATAAAPARVFYITDGDTVQVWPNDSVELHVEAYQQPARLVDGADVCRIPKRYSELIVDVVARKIEKDAHNWNAMQALTVEIADRISSMRDRLLSTQHVSHERIRTFGDWA